MRGEFIGVWSELWRQVWSKLARNTHAPEDLFCELYRELEPAFVERLDEATALASILDNPTEARKAFRTTRASALRGELAVIEFLERAYKPINEMGEDPLSNRYFLLIERFIETYSLRYDLRRPFSLHPTLPGVFARLIRELRLAVAHDPALLALLREFDEAVRDLKGDPTSGKIKTCIQKEINLLEAITGRCPGITAGTLGAMCDQVGTWPHVTIKEAAKKMYGFASNYPGIRHGGHAAGALREIEMKDMIAVSVLLAGFMPYLSDMLNSDKIYNGE
ncbi:MAG: hypothetical protein AAFX81_14100 [Pseudomonadota bacterium]